MVPVTLKYLSGLTSASSPVRHTLSSSFVTLVQQFVPTYGSRAQVHFSGRSAVFI